MPRQPRPLRPAFPIRRLPGALTLAVALTWLTPVAAQPQQPPAVPPAASSPVVEAATQTVRLAEAGFVRGARLPAWARPLRAVPAKTRDEPYVLRLAQTQFRAGDKPATLVHRVAQVNQSSALALIGQLPINFVPHYQRLTLHAVKVQRGAELSDRTQTVSVRFLDAEPGLDSGVYSGAVLANLLLEDVRVGDIVHLTYSLDGANPVFRDIYADTAAWDRVEGTDLRVVEVVAPEGKLPDWRMLLPGAWAAASERKAGRAVTPQISTADGQSVMTFEESGLAGIEDEPQVPSDEVTHRWLQFSGFRSWAEVAQWAQTLFPAVTELPPAVQPVLADIRKLATPEERAAAALRWVQSEVRYFSVSFGESSHRPYSPAEVIARRYGDCKDKSYLLVALLRALDIEARPLLVSLRSPRAAATLLPTPLAFDHAIVELRIGERRYYVDATRFAQDVPLAVLTTALPNAWALPADAAATALIELPGIAPELAVQDLDERIVIKNFDDPPTLEARLTVTGYAAEVMRYGWAQATPEVRRQITNGGYEKRYPGALAVGEPTLSDEPDKNRVVLTSRLTLPGAIRERDGNRAIGYSPDSFAGFFSLPEKARRVAPVLVGAVPYTARYRITVDWPDNVSRTADPSVNRFDGDYFKADAEHQFRGNSFVMRASISSKVARIDGSRLAAMREEVRKFEAALGSVSYVPAASVQSRGFLGIGKLTMQQRMRRDNERRAEAAGAAIKAGKLEGEDLAAAYCERAYAQSYLGAGSEALADAEQAVKLAPSDATALGCRAEVRFNGGDFAGSIADLSRAITLSSAPGELYYRRGHSRFFAGQYEQAAADFARAADAKFSASGSGSAHYAQLWQVWSLQRAGQPLPDKLAAQAKAEAGGPWPRSALAMLFGFRTPEQVLAELNAMSGDEREMNLAEGHFYLGEYWITRGDTERARREFELARSKEVIFYIEHVAAAHELKRLAK